MSNRLTGPLGRVLCLALLTLGCSQAEQPQAATQPADGGWVEASVPPPPPSPSTANAGSSWQEAPVQARSAPGPVSTELPPGFVEVAPPTPPAPTASGESEPASSGDFSDVSAEKRAATKEQPAASAEKAEPAAVSTPATAAFLAANKTTIAKLEELHATLASLRDDTTARAAAEKLPQVTEQFVAQSKAATAMMLLLPEQEKKQALQQLQLDMIGKFREGEGPMQPDLIELCEGIAKGPQREILHDAIVAMRDEMLDQHSIYVPVTTREKIAKRLGAKGSPLPR